MGGRGGGGRGRGMCVCVCTCAGMHVCENKREKIETNRERQDSQFCHTVFLCSKKKMLSRQRTLKGIVLAGCCSSDEHKEISRMSVTVMLISIPSFDCTKDTISVCHSNSNSSSQEVMSANDSFQNSNKNDST